MSNQTPKVHIPLGYPKQTKRDKQHKIYMANAKILHWGSNSTYIPLTRFGVSRRGNTHFRVGIGGNANFSDFRYQHVGIGNAKLWRWGCKSTPGPNAKGFASQWNIGYKLHAH